MPRPAKGIRLHLRNPGKTKAVWVIKDGDKRISTGCGVGDRAGAEIQLATYIQAAHKPERRKRGLHEISVADVIAIYVEDRVAAMPDPEQRKRAAGRAERLLQFFGRKMLEEITGATCRAYAKHRGNQGGARRDLQDLSAAIGHHHREGYHRELVLVDLPSAGRRRERWLTRSEIAKLVWTAWSYRSAMPIPGQYQVGTPPPGDRRPTKHIARAILMAYYTGSRPGDVLRASYHVGGNRSYIDLDAGIFHRRPEGKQETTKRQPPCVLGDRILSHLRRWKETKQCASYVVEFDGAPVKSIKTGFKAVVKRSGLQGEIVPYSFRHSRATHLLDSRWKTKDVADALGTSEAMVERHYGHLVVDRAREVANVGRVPKLSRNQRNEVA
jgi:integrase